jgi:phosphoglycolate phosphatase
MIGDTTHDLQMAENAGTGAIAVEYGAHESADLHAMKPLFSAKTVPELHHWLNHHA